MNQNFPTHSAPFFWKYFHMSNRKVLGIGCSEEGFSILMRGRMTSIQKRMKLMQHYNCESKMYESCIYSKTYESIQNKTNGQSSTSKTFFSLMRDPYPYWYMHILNIHLHSCYELQIRIKNKRIKKSTKHNHIETSTMSLHTNVHKQNSAQVHSFFVDL